MRELYVYYRVAAADAPAALRQVAALFERLKRGHPGLQARLLKRPQPQAGQETWMEVYTQRQGVDTELETAIAQAARDLPAARVGERHWETFETVEACEAIVALEPVQPPTPNRSEVS